MEDEERTEERALSGLAWLVETEGKVWAIRPEVLRALESINFSAGAIDRAATLVSEVAELDPAKVEAARGRGRPRVINGGVAVIELKGILMPQVSLLAALFGMGSGLNTFRSQLIQATTDPDVGAIVLDIDSPGGLVDQIPETAALVREARERKPVVAVANTLAASAAYWIAAQAEEVVVTPSGEIGSIGVYATHQDLSKSLESRGIKVTLISAGKFKVEGNPYEPLNDDARQAMQKSVDDYYSMFVKDVAAGRSASASDVKNGYGEGRVLPARRAVDDKLADRVDTLDNVVAGLLRRSRGQNGPSPGATVGELDQPQYNADERLALLDVFGAVVPRKEVVN